MNSIASGTQGDRREALLAAGLRLADGGRRADQLDGATVAAEAQLPAVDFSSHFNDVVDFQTALLSRLLDRFRDHALDVMAADREGSLRIKRGIEAYLDDGLDCPLLRELTGLLQAHAPARTLLRRRMNGFNRILQVEFSTRHVLYPLAAAQVVTTLVVETATAEHEEHRALPEMREIIYAHLDHLQR